MKKSIFILILIFASIVSMAADRSLRISTGYTMISPITLGASDTTNTSETTTFTITNLQKYAQMQVFTVGLTDVSGVPSVTITAYGKVTASSDWVAIGSAITWTTTANDGTISSTSPINYNYLKVTFVASGATQQTLISTFEVKTSNAYDIPANSGTFTVARATEGTVTITTKDNDANAATVYRAGGTGALTVGASTGTTAITSSDWAIDATGIMTGIGTIASGKVSSSGGVDLGTSQALTGTTAMTIGNNGQTVAINSSDWDIGATGIMTGMGAATFDGVVTATGGIVYPTVSTHLWTAGGSVVLATAGTDVACSNGDRYWSEIMIPYNVTLTGLSYLVGSVGATDSVVMQLFNSAGVEVATTKTAGATHGALVGTAAQFQSIDFAASYAAVAGVYYVAVQFNGVTAKFRAYPIPGSTFVAGTVAGTWDTKADITPGITFTASKGPIVLTH